MKKYITGTITGISMMAALFLFVGATSQQKNDSLNTIMGQLDNYVQHFSNWVKHEFITCPAM